MGNRVQPAPWAQPSWRQEVHSWIWPALEAQGYRPVGEIETIKQSAWSAVLKIPTQEGAVYFKASLPVLGFEPQLTQALAAWRPDCILPVIAIEPSKGWMLMPDAGEMLRNRLNTPEDLHHWHTILPLYAGLQKELAGRVDELLEMGVFDRRLAILPDRFEALVDDREAMLIDTKDGLSSQSYARLVSLKPRFREMCAELASRGIPETLHHDDFHDANVFIRDGRYVFTDWAESCVAHPFFSLVVNRNGILNQLDLADDAPELDAVRDSYLKAWAEYGTLDELRETFELARRIGMVNRALTWKQVLSQEDEASQAKYAFAVPAWMEEFLAVMPEAK